MAARLFPQKPLVKLLAVVGIVLAALSVAALVIGSSEPALRWAARKAVAGSDGALVLDGVSGSTFHGVAVQRLLLKQKDVEIDGRSVSLRWSPLALLWGTIKFADVSARDLRVALPPSSDQLPKLPQHLKPPIRIALIGIAVDRLLVMRDGRAYRAEEISGDIVLGRGTWDWQLAAARTPVGAAQLNLELGARRPFDLRADLALTRREKTAYSASLAATGSLVAPDLKLSANGGGAVVKADALLAPFEFSALRRFSIEASGVNPMAWNANLPSADLSIRGRATPLPDKRLTGNLTVTNAAPGSLDARRIPLRTASTSLLGASRDLALPVIQIDFGKGGKFIGSGGYRPRALTLTLNTSDFNLQAFKDSFDATRLAGVAAITTEGEGQRYRIDLKDPRYAIESDILHTQQALNFNRTHLRARASRFDGSGRLALTANREFEVKGAIAGVNPADFAKKAPSGSLNGSIAANGRLAPALDSRARFNITRSKLAGQPAQANGSIGTRRVNDRLDLTIKASASVGATRASVDGTFIDPASLQKLKLNMKLSGDDLGKLYPLLNIPLPPTPNYRLSGLLIHEGKLWKFQDFKGVVGNSDLAGDFSVDHSRKQKMMRGNLISRNLDLKDLGGFVGAETKPDAPERVRGPRVLPNNRFNLTKLHAADADIKFEGAHIKTRRLPLEDMTAHLELRQGQLKLDPLNFGVAGGNIVSTITLDSNVKNVQTRADVRAKQLELSKLFPGFNPTRASAGAIGGAAKIAGTGSSVAEIMGSMDGDIGLVMNGGSLSELLLRLANLDIQNTAKVLLTGDRQIPVRCLVADFKATNGLLETQALVLDSGKENIIGSGTINLRDELFDLKLVAQPKDTSLVALRGPILIQGSFEKPSVRPQMGGVIARTMLAAALASVAGPLGLIPLIDLGNAGNNDCDELMAEAKKLDAPRKAAPAGTSKSR